MPADEIDLEPLVRRVLPAIDPLNRDFWQGGEHGELRIVRCDHCGTYVHPPSPLCPNCRSFEVRPTAVSGNGTVYSFTISRYQWFPDFPPPYLIVQAQLDEQADLVLVGNWTGGVDHPPTIGMPTKTTFVRYEDVHLPMFGPAGDR